MHILIANDDGYLAPGLAALHRALSPLGRVTVVAPEQNHSGASNSLTLQRPLSVFEATDGAQKGFRFVNGTPTDCVHIALTGMIEEKPDLVVSGINQGQNMGEDVLYSGTVAAAIEGYLFGIPSIAFSQVDKGWTHLDAAERVVREVVERYLSDPLEGQMLLNVNIPNLPYSELGGWRATRLGKRHQSQPVIRQANPRGEPIFWVGAAGGTVDADPVTGRATEQLVDRHAVELAGDVPECLLDPGEHARQDRPTAIERVTVDRLPVVHHPGRILADGADQLDRHGLNGAVRRRGVARLNCSCCFLFHSPILAAPLLHHRRRTQRSPLVAFAMMNLSIKRTSGG